MTVDCKWMSAHLEAYCCDRLSGEECAQARLHFETCSACREELAGLEAIDPLVKKLFRYRMAVARSPRTAAPRRRWVPATAAVLALSAVLVVALFLRPVSVPSPDQTPAIAPATPAITQESVPKDAGPEDVARAKPDAIANPASGPAAAPPPAAGNLEPFSVIDPGGYVSKLENYRGYVLVFGVVSANGQDAQNLDRIYQTYAANAKFRLLGVSPSRPADSRFPLVRNFNSTLLGARDGEFVVLDANGTERLRGSLLTDTATLDRTIRTLLAQ